jgi:hypothetical protein
LNIALWVIVIGSGVTILRRSAKMIAALKSASNSAE